MLNEKKTKTLTPEFCPNCASTVNYEIKDRIIVNFTCPKGCFEGTVKLNWLR